jgi:hypothetical protein
MPILGVIASSSQQGRASDFGAYEPLAVATVPSGGVASITFGSIPQTYTHLQVRAIGRSNRTGTTGEFIKLTFNSDSGSNYADHAFFGDGTTVAAQSATSAAFIRLNRFAGSLEPANVFGTIILDIVDYANTSKNKTVRNFGGIDNNGSGDIWFMSGLWQSTSAITSVTLTPGGGTLYSQYSQFALYGIKGN